MTKERELLREANALIDASWPDDELTSSRHPIELGRRIRAYLAAPQTGLGTSCPDKDNRQSASAAPDSGGMPEEPPIWDCTCDKSWTGVTCKVVPLKNYDTLEAYALSLRAEAQKREGWIPVSERLPEEHIGKFLVTNNLKARDAFGFMSHVWLATLLHYDDEHGWCAFDDYDNRVHKNITHWMPLPAAPEGK